LNRAPNAPRPPALYRGIDPLLRVFASLERERARDETVLDFSSAMWHEFASQALAPVQDRCRHASDADIDLLADLMLRLTMTLFLIPLPGGHAQDHVRRTLERQTTQSAPDGPQTHHHPQRDELRQR